jgi:hypothetical protein
VDVEWSLYTISTLIASKGRQIMPSDYYHIGLQNLLTDPQFQSFVDYYARSDHVNVDIKEFLSLFDTLAKKHLCLPTTLMDSLMVWDSPFKSIDLIKIKTGKFHSEVLKFSIRLTLIAVLCVLVGTRSKLCNLKETENGFMLRATVPADIWSFEGDAYIALSSQDNGTSVKATAEIKGQLYDWGKAKRWLNKLFVNFNIVSEQIQYGNGKT